MLRTSNVAASGRFTTPIFILLTLPTGSSSSTTTANLGVTTSLGNGTLFWVVSTSSTPPTITQILLGQDSTGAPAAASGSQSVVAPGVQSASATGLTSSTTYTAFFFQNFGLSISAVVGSASFATNPTLANLVGYVPANFNMQEAGQDFRPGLIGNPLDFTGLAAWSQSAASMTTGFTAPDNTTTAQKLVENSANAIHLLQSGTGPGQPAPQLLVQTLQNAVWRLAFIAAPAGRTRCVVAIEVGGGPTTVSAGFDLAGGNTGYDNSAAAGWTIVGTSMTSLPNSFFLCKLDVTSTISGAAAPCPVLMLDNGSGTAARSVTYAGNGSSGVLIWFCSFLPLGAWNLTNQAFFDDFASIGTIDVNNTKAAGFNWYTNNDWPNNSMNRAGVPGFFRSSPTPANFISVSSSVLTLSSDISGYGSGLMTVVSTGGTNFIGQTFPLSFLKEAKAGWDPTNANIGSVPAFWTADIEELTGVLPFGGTEIEIDYFEASKNVNPSDALHNWSISQDTQQANAKQATSVSWENTLANLNNLNSYGQVWLGPQDNGGVYGMAVKFYKGIFVQQTDSRWSPTNVFLGSPVGTWSSADGQKFPVIIGAGTSWPVKIDYVRVMTNPSPPPVLYQPNKINPVSSITATGATVTENTTQSGGTLFWVCINSNVAPTATQIQAGQDSGGVAATASGSQAVSAIGAQTITVTGLSLGSWAFFAVQNISGTLSNIDGVSFANAGAGDIVTGAAAWYGLRAYTFASIGANCVKVRRSSDNTTKIFVTVAGGGINQSDAFLDGSTYFVDTLYDQSGNGLDLTQATLINQPRLYQFGVSGKPLIGFQSASALYLRNTSYSAVAQPFSTSTVFNQSQVVANSTMFSSNTGGVKILNDPVSASLMAFNAGSLSTSVTCTDGFFHSMNNLWNGASSTVDIDNTSTSISVGANGIATNAALGTNTGSLTDGFFGFIAEFGIWSGDQSSHFAALSLNQQCYYPLSMQVAPTVYQGPADILASPTAWYGLRAMSLAAIGQNVIQLRAADTTTQNFVSVAGGKIDTASISAFIVAHGACTVATLYDQSGNGNHLTQSTAANQPTFSLTGGANSNPVINFTSSLWLQNTSWSTTVNQPFTVSGVINNTSGASRDVFRSTSGATAILLAFDGSGNFEINAGSFQTVAAANNTWFAFNILFNGASSFIMQNGVDNSVSPGANKGSTVGDTVVLNDQPQSTSLGFAFEEAGFWPVTSTNANRTSLNTNQRNFWGF